MESCKPQTFSCCLLNNTNKNHPKSCNIPTKFQIPKSLSFAAVSKSISHFSNFPCSSSSPSSSRFSVNALDSWDGHVSRDEHLINYLMYEDHSPPEVVLTVTILLLDEDRKLKQKLDELVGKRFDAQKDAEEEADITLNKVVPLLLENSSLWMSSRLIVSSNLKHAFLKLLKSEQLVTDKITPQNDEQEALVLANPINATCCTEVFMDVCITGILDSKFKDIYTRDDLKGLLNHLASTVSVRSASTLCLPVLVSSEKGKELEGFSHVTT